ncbi:hypothetical protein IC582_029454 [Cucumis melo]
MNSLPPKPAVFLLLLFSVIFVGTHFSIAIDTSNSTIQIIKDGDHLVSTNKNFTLGFFISTIPPLPDMSEFGTVKFLNEPSFGSPIETNHLTTPQEPSLSTVMETSYFSPPHKPYLFGLLTLPSNQTTTCRLSFRIPEISP